MSIWNRKLTEVPDKELRTRLKIQNLVYACKQGWTPNTKELHMKFTQKQLNGAETVQARPTVKSDLQAGRILKVYQDHSDAVLADVDYDLGPGITTLGWVFAKDQISLPDDAAVSVNALADGVATNAYSCEQAQAQAGSIVHQTLIELGREALANACQRLAEVIYERRGKTQSTPI